VITPRQPYPQLRGLRYYHQQPKYCTPRCHLHTQGCSHITSRPYRCRRRRRRNGDPHATAARRLCTTRLRSAWVRRISFWRIAGLRHVALLQQRPRLRHGHDPGAGVRPGHLRVGVDHTCVVSCDARAPSTAGTAHCWWSLLENPRGASRRWLLKGSVSLALCLSVAVRYCVCSHTGLAMSHTAKQHQQRCESSCDQRSHPASATRAMHPTDVPSPKAGGCSILVSPKPLQDSDNSMTGESDGRK